MSPRLILTIIASISIGLLFSWMIGMASAETGLRFGIWGASVGISGTSISPAQELSSDSVLREQFDKYLERKEAASDRWLTFMWILSTFFAAFFIYSSLKIDKDLRDLHWNAHDFIKKLEKEFDEKIEKLKKESENEIAALEEKSEQEKMELRQERNFLNIRDEVFSRLFENDFEGAKGALKSAEKDWFATDDDKLNTLNYLWSKAYFAEWQSLEDKEKGKKIELLANAMIFADAAIVDPNDPYRKLLLKAYNEHQ